MRNLKKNRKFGRQSAQRKALIASLSRSLILHEGITTTEPKAKDLRPYVEKLVTRSRSGGRRALSLLKPVVGEEAARKLVEVIGPRYVERPGGYTRIIKMPTRASSAARMARIEFVQ